MRRNIFFIVLAFTLLSGCGYTTHSVLPSGRSSIHIDNFVNKIEINKETSDSQIYQTYKPGMESDVARKVIDKFIFDGNYEIKNPREASFLLKGALVDFQREPLRYDANDNVIEYRVNVVVDIELYDRKEGKLLWSEKSFAGESTYRTTGQFAKSEDVAIGEAVSDLARRIVERTVESW